MSDELGHLMRLSQGGDSKSYHQLLIAVTPMIRKIVREKWFADQHMIEDIVQEVLLALHNARHTYDHRRPFKPWLYAITRYRIAESGRIYARKHKPETPQSGEIIYETFPDESANGEQEDFIVSDALGKALEKLPQKQRQAVELVKLQGLSMEEAAKKAGISVSAMKVNAHRGYKNLKDILQKQEAA